MNDIPVKPLTIHQSQPKQNCFGGAWYHKVMSIQYPFYGIEGTITLPLPFIKRYDQSFKVKHVVDINQRNLDVSSIYIGGHASDESDVGLALFRGYLGDKLSTGSFVYRPFWRYITDEHEDVGTYNLAAGRNYAATLLSERNGIKNVYAQYHPSFTEHYYLPGDTLKLTLFSPKPHFMQLRIEVIQVSKLPYAVNLRRRYKMKSPMTFLSPMFSSKGHGTDIPKTYKRVNAIDQVKNEGKEAILTRSEILNAHWHNCYLYYKEQDLLFKTPFNEAISVTMQCPNPKAFFVTPIDLNTGGQMISIRPSEVNR